MINLKKTLAALLAAVMTIAATAMPAMADSATLGDMTYNAYNNYDASYGTSKTSGRHDYYYYERNSDGEPMNGILEETLVVGMTSDNLHYSVRDLTAEEWEAELKAKGLESFTVYEPSVSFVTVNGYEYMLNDVRYGDYDPYDEKYNGLMNARSYTYIDAKMNMYRFTWEYLPNRNSHGADLEFMVQSANYTYPNTGSSYTEPTPEPYIEATPEPWLDSGNLDGGSTTTTTTNPDGSYTTTTTTVEEEPYKTTTTTTVTTFTPSSSNDSIGIYVDGYEVYPDSAPVIQNDRTLVPIRVVAEALGFQVDWDSANQAVEIHNFEESLYLTIGSSMINHYIYDSWGNISSLETLYSDVAPQIINDRTYLPLRAVGEALGAEVDWDGNTRSVYISGGAVG